MTFEFWDQVLAVREVVKQELERLRVAGDIGSSLDAEVDLYCSPELAASLSKLKDELRFVFIVSYARVHVDASPKDSVATVVKGLQIKVSASTYPKCIRCWHHRADVGTNPEHTNICSRCVANLDSGEARSYA